MQLNVWSENVFLRRKKRSSFYVLSTSSGSPDFQNDYNNVIQNCYLKTEISYLSVLKIQCLNT